MTKKRKNGPFRRGKDPLSGAIVERLCDSCGKRRCRAADDAVRVTCSTCVAEMLTPTTDGIKTVAGPATTAKK